MYHRVRLSQPGVASVLLLLCTVAALPEWSRAEPGVANGIPVKFVHDRSVYLGAGSSSGLTEGQKLEIRRKGLDAWSEELSTIGEIVIESVAPNSAAGRILSSQLDIAPGDSAYLSRESLQEAREQAFAVETQKYPQIVSFTQGAPPEQETRENIPKPPLPEINRIRGRIGIDSSFLQVPDRGIQSSQFGYMLRLDATRLGSTYWSISGYHRGRFVSRKNYEQETLTDLLNRTYQFSLNYSNPKNSWVAGVGRVYVPWASSLNTMDGFYLGRRIGKQTVGIFGGTNPDPTSWNYDPDRQMAGAFVNLERGSFESFRFTSTSGIAVSRVDWHPDRQFGFFENGIFYKHYLSVYSNVEADLLNSGQNGGRRDVTLSRSYTTIRLQPHRVVAFDINQNYFRNVPTFDSRLIGTGLLDKYLFQGLSAGIRLALPYHVGFYASSGRSSRTGDQKASWNYLAGITLGNIFSSGIRADYRYSRFDSSFGRGNYQSITAVRDLESGLRFELQYGHQSVSSSYTRQNSAHFVNGTVDWNLSRRYFAGIGITGYRGQVQKYSQYFLRFGYRFDNRERSQ